MGMVAKRMKYAVTHGEHFLPH